jgi:hypothetical protein
MGMLREKSLTVSEVARQKLSRLTPAELTEMATALETLKNIGAKLE